MTKKRVVIAGFQHETNTFCPIPTTLPEFERQDAWPALTQGDDVIEVFAPLNIPIGGFISAKFDWELIPIVWTSAEPAGLVTAQAFNHICALICDGIRQSMPVDGVLLDLHGAMVVEDVDDGELEIARRVREIIGEEIPLVCSLDFHANISPEFVDTVSAITIFRHYPHIDMAETGERAAKLLNQILLTGEPFCKSFKQVDYLIPLSSQGTTRYPCNEMYAGFCDFEQDGVDSVDAAAGFTSADIYHCGPSIVAYGTNQNAVDQAVEHLYQRFLNIEGKITDELLTSAQAVEAAAELITQNPFPVVLADVQDNPGAGGTSDTTGILQELIQQDVGHAIVGVINDPDSVRTCWQKGIGAQLQFSLGNAYVIEGATDFAHDYTVEFLTDKPVLCTGEMYGGCEADLGKMALLKANGLNHDIFVVLSSQRFQCLDLALFRHVGLVIEKPQIILVKSTIHFLADFDPVAQRVLFVESPGVNPCRLNNVNYKNLRPNVRVNSYS